MKNLVENDFWIFTILCDAMQRKKSCMKNENYLKLPEMINKLVENKFGSGGKK